MIYRGQTGQGMTALINYLAGEGRDEHRNLKLKLPGEQGRATLIGGLNFGFEPRTEKQADIARRMMEFYASPKMQGGKTKYCAKDAMHISLSWHKGYQPDHEEKMRAAREVLAAQGLENQMALIYEHDDKGPHIHIAVTRVDKDTGMAIDDHQSRYRGMAWALDWEERNDQITPPRHWQHGLRNLTRGEDWQPDELRKQLLEKEATIPRHTLDLAIALGGNFEDELERRRAVVTENMLRLRRWKNSRLPAAYTTPEIWAEEGKTIAAASRLHKRDGFQVPEEIIKKNVKRFKLTEQQETAFRHATGPEGFAMLSGQAGVGKSRVLSATREAYLEMGFDVRGNAHTHQVVQQLEKDGFRDAATISSDVERLKRGRSPWRGPTVVMPDEAAQLDTPEQLYNLFGFASRTPNIKVIPTGDYRQLGSIGRGGLHRPLENIFGSAQMTEIMRTKDKDLAAAMSAMHDREWPKVVQILNKKGAIHWSPDMDAAISKLADRYMEDLAKDPEATRLVMTLTNANADALNKELRKRLRAQQPTPTKQMKLDTARGPVTFGVGDRVVLNETAFSPEDKAKGLTNGAFGTVLSLDERDDGRRTMTMKLDRARKQQQRVQTFAVGADREAGEMFDVSHGWASTNFKAQGKTVDYGYGLMDPRGTAPGNYVQGSRMARQFYLGVNREETHDIIELGKQLGHGPDKTAAHAYWLDPDDEKKLKAEREKTMAKKENDDKWRKLREHSDRLAPEPTQRQQQAERQSQAQAARNFRQSVDKAQAKREQEAANFRQSADQAQAKREREAATGPVRQAANNWFGSKARDEWKASMRQALEEQEKRQRKRRPNFNDQLDPNETLRRFGYPEETIAGMDAAIRRQTAAQLNQAYRDGPPVQRQKPGFDIDSLLNDRRHHRYRESWRETAHRLFGTSHEDNPNRETQNNYQDHTVAGGFVRRGGEAGKGNLQGDTHRGDKKDRTNATQRHNDPLNWFGFKPHARKEEDPMPQSENNKARTKSRAEKIAEHARRLFRGSESRDAQGQVNRAFAAHRDRDLPQEQSQENDGGLAKWWRKQSPQGQQRAPEQSQQQDQATGLDEGFRTPRDFADPGKLHAKQQREEKEREEGRFMDEVHRNLGTDPNARDTDQERKRQRDDRDRGRSR
jgi:hypothetical protein